MAKIKAFRGLRPHNNLAEKVAELPYDVVSTDEARAIAGENPYSFFHISKPEIGMPDNTDPYNDSVYYKGKENLKKFISEKILIQDETECLYLYTQIMNGRAQTGLVACLCIDDYLDNRVKKHELTREDKENDRTKHLDILNANTGPVFLLFNENGSKESLFKKGMDISPEVDFTARDGIRHIMRKIDDKGLIHDFITAFKDDILYIADGHHRAASAVNVGVSRRKKESDFTGNEEYNYFLCVIFPHDELKILPYNRVVSGLNGHSPDTIMKLISEKFTINTNDADTPGETGRYSMYLSGRWSTLVPKFDIPAHPIHGLDVKILQDTILGPILGIEDPRKDRRINFIGGIRGTAELEKKVKSGEYDMAFSMYPTTIEQLMAVSDSGGIMPPKSTWFEPKLRSGLVLHLL